MSSYIVDDKTINKIVAGLQSHHMRNKYPSLPECLRIDERDHAPLLGENMYKLNLHAVNARYPDTVENSKNLPGPCDELGNHAPYTYRNENYHGQVPLYKSIQCFLYQCSDGNTEDPLFIELDKFNIHLASEILSSLDTYENAPWG
jgi:hypothetical protein